LKLHHQVLDQGSHKAFTLDGVNTLSLSNQCFLKLSIPAIRSIVEEAKITLARDGNLVPGTKL
jgi:hypothetical protein